MLGDLTPTPRPALAWAEHEGAACLRLTGVAAEAGDGRLAVLPGEVAPALVSDRRLQPMAGRFVRSADGVVFLPRFPFLGGTTYSVVVAPCAAFPEGLVLSLPRAAAPMGATPAVMAIHPDSDRAPLNLLKIYVRFSEPMAEGAARRGVRIEDALTGEPLAGVFLDMGPELWDPERRRLTLLLDPGRIKRGLAPHQEAGYPLTEGASVRISIGPEFRSAAGAPIGQPFAHTYAIGPALRRVVDPDDWRLDVPDAGSLAPLSLVFDRPLDHAMLGHAFQVVGADGCAIAGTGVPEAGETGWTFQPSKAWASGQHRLIVDARLEDLAGNSLRRVFDRDLTRKDDLVTEADHVALPFRCR